MIARVRLLTLLPESPAFCRLRGLVIASPEKFLHTEVRPHPCPRIHAAWGCAQKKHVFGFRKSPDVWLHRLLQLILLLQSSLVNLRRLKTVNRRSLAIHAGSVLTTLLMATFVSSCNYEKSSMGCTACSAFAKNSSGVCQSPYPEFSGVSQRTVGFSFFSTGSASGSSVLCCPCGRGAAKRWYASCVHGFSRYTFRSYSGINGACFREQVQGQQLF